ncbi:serine/threonine-protein kinase [Agromyces sp. C10]|uniref:serine/threonine-protein kinase n=1 Tax=Agromyces sp. C10 TaxID=2935077 RepID=UPI00200A16F2|nr:serine/threonine-protein kinase [Agromyces sp. C10]MCK8607995.1 serine/threonine protein kinase [Agromyces sp. C10]
MDPSLQTDPSRRTDPRAMPYVPAPTQTPIPTAAEEYAAQAPPYGAEDHSTPRYEFLEHIGSGGMADVYRARDNELGRHVAIKLFRESDETVADRQRREREIHLLSGLTHVGLVPVYDAGTLIHAGVERRYIVMELIEGLSLAHQLADGPLKPRQVADIGAQVADVLSYVHGQGVIHRDIKPENILVSEVPTFGYTLLTRLADFGVAQFVDGTRLTGHGTIMGTAAYISPEQARGEEVTPATDIYSLGLVLLESLKGEREYLGTPIEAALARLHRSPEIPEDLTPEWRALLAAMTADDPAVRPTAHDVASTMRDIIRIMLAESAMRKGRAPSWVRMGDEAEQTSRKRLLLAVGGLAVGVTGMVVAIAVGLAAASGAFG